MLSELSQDDEFMTDRYYFPTFFYSCAVLAAAAVLFAGSARDLSAQPLVTIENAFTSVSVVTDQNAGRFWFATGAQHGYTRYLYHGAKLSTTVTSNVVFRVKRGNEIHYFCNTPYNFANGGVRPEGPSGPVPFEPYDSIRVSPGRDTIEVLWLGVDFLYDITMRFVAEKPRHEYDNGADILLEFEYRQSGPAPSGSDLGIFLMLDGDNGTIVNGVASDHSSVLTDMGYYSTNEFGKSFQKDFGGIPEFCMTGWFEYTEPLNDIFSIHRLSGTSLGGAPLTTPNNFAVGNWKDFRSLTWNFNADLASKQIGDVATAMRWENLGAEGMIRTAFGTTSKTGNNIYHCRDSNVFVAIRTERLVKQAQINGPYSPAQFQVEMWVSSLERQLEISPMFRLETPIQSYPSGSGRLTLDPSTPATVTLGLRPRDTKKITWLVNVDQRSEDTLAAFRILYRDTATVNTKPLVPLLDGCMPLVNFRGAFIPPPPDNRPPVIQSTGNGRDNTAWWTFRTFDRHAGYAYDTGLDRIEVIRNDGNNFRLIQTPNPFVRCDTTVTVNLRAEIVDTTRPGNILFRVYDCNGNSYEASAGYTPRPDIFKPDVTRIDSLDGYDVAGYPCAIRTFEVFIEDQRNQTSTAGDAGLGSIDVLSSTNFDPIQINFDTDGSPVDDFDKTASFRLRVTDRLLDADAVVRIADYAGNADTLRFHYCTIPDTDPPVIVSTPGSGSPVKSWSIDVSDKREWDRGLAEVIEISNTNMRVTPWPVPIASGQPEVTGIAVDVVDDAWDGELTLEFRDTYYVESDPTTYAAHSARIQYTFTGIRDTMAPNIIFRRDLTVPANEVVFTAAVNDTHFVGAQLYAFDRGLESVTWRLTPNMRVRMPIAYTDNRRGASLQVEIVDPLAIVEGDTVCIEAVDSAGNRTMLCQAWPSTPDGKSPIFSGRLNAGRTQITGTVRDDRESDRGLGSVTLRNAVNLQPFSLTGINGAPTAPVTIDVIDPEEPIAGELVIRDLVGELEGGAEQSIHTVVIPFSLGTAQIALELPELVEGGEEITAVVRAGKNFTSDDVNELSFDLNHSANGAYANGIPSASVGSFAVTPAGTGGLNVSVTTTPGMEYVAGDELGRITFTAGTPVEVERFRLSLDVGSLGTNTGSETLIAVRTPGDPLASELRLPPPFMRAAADSVTVINGDDCNRVLASGGAASRPNGLAILAMSPQPVRNGGAGLRLLVRDLPDAGAQIELVALDGTRVLASRLEPGVIEKISEVNLALPRELTAGLYFIRLSASTGVVQERVLVVE